MKAVLAIELGLAALLAGYQAAGAQEGCRAVKSSCSQMNASCEQKCQAGNNPSACVARLCATSVRARRAARSGFVCVPIPITSRAGSRSTGSSATAAFPPFQTALGVGLILKVGLPIKIEYAADARRIFGLPRTQRQRDTQLRGVLISAGFQF